MSFDKVDYCFEEKCYIVKGENKDNDGQESNGGGKTSFIDIIAISLLGYSLTGRNVKNCINWHCDDSYFIVSINLENTLTQQHCEIQRKVYSNTKSAELVILVNGKAPTIIPSKKGVENGVDTKAGNAYILNDILDIREQDLLNYFLISKISYQPFLSVNTDKKLEVIGRFSNTDKVEQVIVNLEKEYKTIQSCVNEIEINISKASGYIEALELSLTGDAEKEFEINKASKIKQFQQIEQDLEQKYGEESEERLRIEKEIKSLTLKIEPIDLELKQELEIRKNGLSTKECDVLIAEIQKDIAEGNNYLAGLIECPKCLHKFHLTTKKDVTKDIVTQWEYALIEIECEKDCTLITIADLEEDILLIQELERDNISIQSQIDNENRNIESIDARLLKFEQEVQRATNEQQKISLTKFEDQKQSTVKQIADKQKQKDDLQLQLDQNLAKLTETTKWVDNFNDFKFYLGNKPISIICSLVNKYLKLNGSDLNLYIEGFKKIRSGELRQSLNPIIYRNWQNPQDLVQFSEGERARINISVDMAFQELINNASKTGGLNLYLNDELISGLDSIGVQKAAEAFNQLDKTMLLVTHSGTDLLYENMILIRKQNNISIAI